jgi:hypothetical protein
MMESNAKSNLKKFLLAAIVIAAALVRLYDLTDEPLELHPTRQIRAALIARAFYFPTNPDIPQEDTDFAVEQLDLVGVIEPSILEYLTSLLYRLNGAEAPWLGRLISIAFWLAGGWGVYRLAAEIGSPASGTLALVFYLFLPYGLRFSRTLLPDVMMVSGSVLGLSAFYFWQKKRTLGWAIFAGAITGFAILVKSVAGIILILPFAIFILSTQSLKQSLRDRHLWLILILAALPSAIYYYWGLFIDGGLATQFNGRFFPELWTDLLFYKTWGKRILLEFSLPAFLLAMVGIVLAKQKPDRRMLFAWWVGYFIYGMIFAYHIMTHDYYHLSMIPLTAVSISPAIAALESFAQRKNILRLMIGFYLLAGLSFAIYGAIDSIQFFTQSDYREIPIEMALLDKTLAAAPKGGLVALTEDYGTSLRFYASRKARHWPHLGDLNYFELQGSSPQDLEELWQTTSGASYFFVSDQKELARQPLLAEKLIQLPILLQTDHFTLYQLIP